jgi:hypothetical protein
MGAIAIGGEIKATEPPPPVLCSKKLSKEKGRAPFGTRPLP